MGAASALGRDASILSPLSQAFGADEIRASDSSRSPSPALLHFEGGSYLVPAGRGEILPRGPSCGCGRAASDPGGGGHEATRSSLLDNLAADGFRVAGASGAGEALRAIEVRQPALVVLDLRLEGGSGLDVLDAVRSADGLASRLDPDLPMIVLTGRSGDADRVRSFARGADDHLSKPTRSLVSAL